MQSDLLKKVCIACEGKGIKPFTRDEAEKYLPDVPGWQMSEDAKSISREYKFADFIGSINFVQNAADVAEGEGHHPDIHIFYNKVRLDLTTHAIGGLSENDFIVAAKVDASAKK